MKKRMIKYSLEYVFTAEMEQKEIRKNSQRNAVKHILVEYGTRGEAIYLNNKHSLEHSCLNSKHKGTIRKGLSNINLIYGTK